MQKRIGFITVFLLFRFFLNTADCQFFQCRGIVKDSLARQVLPNATINISDLQRAVVATVVSGSKGAFLIDNLREGKYTIDIKYIGYQSYTSSFSVSASQPEFVLGDVYLPLEKSILTNVTVSATATKPFIVQTGEKIILNVAQSAIASGGNALDAITRGPGVADLNGNLTFRNKKITVMIDGKLTHLSGDDLKEMLTNMPAVNIDKIEILPSPSAKYDAQGGSIINIKLAKNSNDGLNGTVLLGLGSGLYGKYNSGFTLNYKTSRFSFAVGYTFSNSKQYYNTNSTRDVNPFSHLTQDENDIRTRNNNAYRFGIDYQLNKRTTFGIQFKGYSNELSRTVGLHAHLYNTPAMQDTLSKTYTNGNIAIFNPSINLYCRTVLDSAGRELVFNADYFSYDKNWNDGMTTSVTDQDAKIILPDYSLQNTITLKNEVKSVTADFVCPGTFVKFEAGLKTSFATSNNEIGWLNLTGSSWLNDATKSNHFIYKENINAGYVTFSKTFKDVFEVSVGVRAEQTNTEGILVNTGAVTDKHYFNVFPNVNLQYIKNINQIFHFSYRKDIERFGYTVVNPFLRYQSRYNYSRGNPDVVPEIYNSSDLNFTYNQGLVIGINFTTAKKVLVPVYVPGESNSIISTIDNLASSTLFYSYINWSKKIKSWTSNLSGGYGFLKLNTSTLENNKNTWGYMIQWSNTIIFGGWSTEVYASYMSPTILGIYKLGANFTSGLGFSKNILKNKVNLKLSVTDLFNTQVQHAQINYQGIVMTEEKKIESRFVNLSLTYKFGRKNSAKIPRASKADELNKRLAD